jgi:outer membrane protein OmpA-like peptidoglycan-associated protein
VVEEDEPLREGPETAELDERARIIAEAIRDRTLRDSLEMARISRQYALEKVAEFEARKASLTPEERQKRNEWVRKLNAATDRLLQEVNVRANIYPIDFVEVNQTHLTTQGKETLKQIQQELSSACNSGREIVIKGYGCHLGGQKKTLEKSRQRAATIADWIRTNTECKAFQVAAEGRGIDPRVRHLIGRTDPEALAQAAHTRNAFVFILKGVSGLQTLD